MHQSWRFGSFKSKPKSIFSRGRKIVPQYDAQTVNLKRKLMANDIPLKWQCAFQDILKQMNSQVASWGKYSQYICLTKDSSVALKLTLMKSIISLWTPQTKMGKQFEQISQKGRHRWSKEHAMMLQFMLVEYKEVISFLAGRRG